MIGKTLGHYEILGPLGAGGMGEVYRARDTSLKREVAIKVLPEEVAGDRERLARLEREAHLLAALNHPNIATIHSLERSEDTRFLVMELVQGESLQERLASGPLPIEVALDLCTQIAAALEAAHGEGIIHRDLKPANVLVTPDGRAKVLDFGLAKAFEGQAAGDITQSPTLTVAGTQTGVILGTAPYMSPEQARGEPLDKRVDIWAFGCLMYETVTASRAFARETVAGTLAAIIETEPNWGALPSATPPMIVALIKRCLRKDPDRRLHDIADARIEIEESTNAPADAAAPAALPQPTTRASVMPWTVAALAIAVAAVAALTGPLRVSNTSGPQPFAYRMAMPPGLVLRDGGAGVVMARDGSRFFFVASRDGDSPSVWAQKIGDLAPVQLESTEGARNVFGLSPDGAWLLYWVRGELRRAQTSGAGSSISIAGAHPRGALWLPNDDIIYLPSADRGLHRMPVGGGQTTPLTVVDEDATLHRFPQLLPGRESMLMTVAARGQLPRDWSIGVVPIDPGQPHVPVILSQRGSHGRYVAATGHLLFGRDDRLFAVPVDLDTMQTSGIEVPVIDDITVASPLGGMASFDFSEASGTLVYLGPRTDHKRQAQFVNMAGDRRPLEILSSIEGDSPFASFAPQRSDLLVVPQRDGGGERRLIIHRRGRGARRLAVEGYSPVWAPDGRRLAFAHDLGAGTTEIMLVDLTADVETPVRVLETERGIGGPEAFSADGSALLYLEWRGTSYDIMEYSFATETSQPWLATDAPEGGVAVSPDGGRVAYESGGEIYVRTYAPGQPRGSEHQVSVNGGRFAAWSTDGTRLFYVRDTAIMVVGMSADAGTEPGPPEVLFDRTHGGHFEVVPDGSGFVTWPEIDDPNARPVEPVVILNWFEKLRRLAPNER